MKEGKKVATIYFYFWLVFNVFVLINDLSNFDLTEFDYFYLIMTAIALIGIYGYVYNVVFWDKHFWRIFIPIFVVSELYSFGDAYADLAQELQGALLYIAIILCVMLLAPQYLYLYRYSRNKNIWISEN